MAYPLYSPKLADLVVITRHAWLIRFKPAPALSADVCELMDSTLCSLIIFPLNINGGVWDHFYNGSLNKRVHCNVMYCRHKISMRICRGCYSETGFHIGMDRNFVCSWCRHNCRSQVIDLSLSALISWFMISIIGLLNNSNLHAIISTLLIINLHRVKKFILQN